MSLHHFGFVISINFGQILICLFGWGISSIAIITFGAAIVVGIAGAVAIYYIGQGVDWVYEQIKKWIFGWQKD